MNGGAARIGALAAAALLAGCAEEARLPDLTQIYKRSALAAREAGNFRPLIAIPGTLGSRLEDSASGLVIWGGGGSAGISADPEDPIEYALIALPIAKGDEPLSSLRDTVRPTGILETAEAEILGIPIDVDVYGKSIGVLAQGGFLVDRRPAQRAADKETAQEIAEDFNTFQFDYDWRRDLIETAHEFGRFLQQRRILVASKRAIPPQQVRFDLLAHSMGGLVARYFLMYGFADPGEGDELPPITWEGAKFFSRVVFVAPPNAGSVIALDNLINGKELGPLQPVYPPELLATHPSAYQLMPRGRHRRVLRDGTAVPDLYDIKLWEKYGWGLANPAIDTQLQLLLPGEPTPEKRRARALAHKARLLQRARVFHEMMDRWEPAPEWLDLFLVVGGGFETPALAEIDPLTGAFEITAVEEGDGVVLRSSALLDERQDGTDGTGFRSPLRFKTTLFLPDEHVELTNNEVFGDNLFFWLLEAPRGGRLARPKEAGLLGKSGDRAAAEAPDEQFQAGAER